MFKFQNILFPVEFSQRDEAAAPFVLSMAQRHRARVVLLHAVQLPIPMYAGMGTVYPESFDSTAVTEGLLANLKKFAEEQLPKLAVECVVELGEAAATISEYACNHGSNGGIDLIAMPTHGYGVFRRALLGSVTAKVLHDSALPVWTSAHAPEPSHRAHPQPRRILCALDLKPESRHTLEAAIALAKEAGARLEIVHVPAETMDPSAAELHLQSLLAEVADAGIAEFDEEPGTAPLEEGDRGSVAEGVRNLALRKRVDLVVIGRGAIRRGLGQVYAHSYEIIRESPCPVISV